MFYCKNLYCVLKKIIFTFNNIILILCFVKLMTQQSENTFTEVPNGRAPPLLLAPNFGIQDPDGGNINYVKIDLKVAYDLDLEFLSFPTTGGNISILSTTSATKDNGFTHSYLLTGPSSIQIFSQVLIVSCGV